jgi:hypothetical protein
MASASETFSSAGAGRIGPRSRGSEWNSRVYKRFRWSDVTRTITQSRAWRNLMDNVTRHDAADVLVLYRARNDPDGYSYGSSLRLGADVHIPLCLRGLLASRLEG